MSFLREFIYLTESDSVRGKIDYTPEGVYVGTEFWCILGIAVLPQRAKIYTDESTTKYMDFSIPHDFRSILAGYARASAVLAAVVGVPLAFLFYFAGTVSLITPILAVMLAPLWGVFTRSLFRRASPARAKEIMDTLEFGAPQTGFGSKRRGFDVGPTVPRPSKPAPRPRSR